MISSIIAGRIGRAVGVLNEGMLDLESGDLTEKKTLKTKDELGHLTRTLSPVFTKSVGLREKHPRRSGLKP